MFSPPLDPDGSEHVGKFLQGARAHPSGDGGWMAVLAVENADAHLVERWSFGSVGITVDGSYAVGVDLFDVFGAQAPLAFNGEGALVVLLPAGAALDEQREVMHVPLDGEPQTVMRTTPSPDESGQVRHIYGLLTGP